MQLLFIGVSGSGKDTQANLLVNRHGFHQISTGQLLRERSSQADAFGRQLQAQMQQGFLATAVIEQVLADHLASLPTLPENIIFNGVVRKFEQIAMLDRLLANFHAQLDHAIYFDLSEAEAVHRLFLRRHCSENPEHIYHLEFYPPKQPGVCDIDGAPLYTRRDDQPESIHARLVDFQHDNKQIYQEYSRRNLLATIDASKPIEGVYQDLIKALKLTEVTAQVAH